MVDSLHLWSGGPGFKVQTSLLAEFYENFARVRLSRNSLPKTAPFVGAFSAGTLFFLEWLES